MKKILSMVAIAIGLAACSGDDSASSGDTMPVTLLKKTITTYSDGAVITTDYSYNKQRLTEINSSDGQKKKYFYDDVKMRKDELFMNRVLIRTREFNMYNFVNQKCTCTTTNHETGKVEKFDYEKDVNDVINITSNQSLDIYKVWLSGSNILKYSINDVFLHDLIYDTKINPLRNIKDNFFLTLLDLNGGNNNIVSIIKSGAENDEINFSYEYNPDDIPSKCIQTDKEGNLIATIQYFYE